MRRLICILLCGFAAIAAAQPADTVVKGRVVDDSGDPVAGATVQLGDETAVTDANGAFSIAGTGALTVTADGFTTAAVTAKQGVVVRLEAADGELIEVTGKAPEESKPLE